MTTTPVVPFHHLVSEMSPEPDDIEAGFRDRDSRATEGSSSSDGTGHEHRLGPGLIGTRLGDGADDPVTGPMPVVSLLGGRVTIEILKGATVISLDGGLDEDSARDLSPAVAGGAAGTSAVILDIDQVTLLDRGALDTVLATFEDASVDAERCVVAPRLSGRMVLERWGVAARLAVFTSVADALQARAFAGSGYGDGWVPGADAPG